MQKKLMRSGSNKMIAGVVAGLAEYFEHDVTLWRLGTVVALIFTGFFPVGLLYIIAIFVIPNQVPADVGAQSQADYVVHD